MPVPGLDNRTNPSLPASTRLKYGERWAMQPVITLLQPPVLLERHRALDVFHGAQGRGGVEVHHDVEAQTGRGLDRTHTVLDRGQFCRRVARQLGRALDQMRDAGATRHGQDFFGVAAHRNVRKQVAAPGLFDGMYNQRRAPQ